jgi:hypothetical protein
MRHRPFIPLACGWVLCMAARAAVPTDSLAQDIVAPVVPIGNPGPYPTGHRWSFWHHHPVFPRTYSYQYDIWFNRPRHTRFVGPDGRAYWRTTVRGLPLGAPWPGP